MRLPFPGQWVVYMLRCRDNTLYTGMTNKLVQRVKRHSRGTASKYTRSRLPVELVWWKFQADRSTAAKTERRIKRLSKLQKEALVEL